jgi:cell division protein ZapA (FtsZ GTPase activity inhibitor)
LGEGVWEFMEPVRVRIRDHEYLIKSDGNQEEVLKVADYVNTKLMEVENSMEGLSERKTAVLAALQIAGDYFQALKERDEGLARMRRQTEALIHQIDSVMD